jgi:glycosyltransferase involved in cell wall biosynthesis
MRIVIDMQGAQTESRFRGIGRYTLSLAQAIVRNSGEHEIILTLNGLFPHTIEPIRATFDGLLPQENIRVWYAPAPVRECEAGNTWRREVAERIREAFLASLQPNVVYITSLFEGYIDDAVTSIGVFAEQIPTLVTLYDLIPLLNPETYLKPYPIYEGYYRRKIEHLKKAKGWLAISEFAAAEGLETLQLEANSITNISTACDPIFHKMEFGAEQKQQFLQRYGINRPFVMYSGGADSRKNLPRLIRAYANLPLALRHGHQLVMVGKMAEGDIQELKYVAHSVGMRDEELIFTGYVTDDELVQFYNICKLFVFPSWHEGFGIPALEAMSCGAAVIGANASSIPEVICYTDALFDPFDEVCITEKMTKALRNEEFRTELIANSMKMASSFCWDKSAKKAIAAFEQVHAVSANPAGFENHAAIERHLINAITKYSPGGISNVDLVKTAHAISKIQDEGYKYRQLFIDISELVQRDARTGVQRVTRSILIELLKNPPDGFTVKPVYAMTDSVGYHYAKDFTAKLLNTTGDSLDDLIDYRPGDIFLGLDLQHHVIATQQNYLAKLRQEGVRVVFVVYDLLPILMPHAFMPGSDAGHKAWLEVLCGFDGAVCISRAVANELAGWMQNNGPKRLRPFEIGWFHLGADVENSMPSLGLPKEASEVLEELLKRPTFLTVGTVEPRKGQGQALAAFEQLWAQGIQANLVIVGKRGWMVEALVKKLSKHPELNKRLFWFEGISDEYLEKIYAASTCLIAASEGEGFGLPLIEAAQHGLPIIARDIPVFREVAGDHAYYFSGLAPKDLADAITAWLVLHQRNAHPKSEGMHYLSWRESALQLKKQLHLNAIH